MEKTGVKWSSEEVTPTALDLVPPLTPCTKNLNTHFSAVAAALDDPELPVKVHAILALTQMVVSHDSSMRTSNCVKSVC
jgi:importin-7